MPITSLARDWGVSPSMVRVVTTDNLSTITAAQYLTTQIEAINVFNYGNFTWVPGDLAGIIYNGGEGIFVYDDVNKTFIATSGSSSILSGLVIYGGIVTTPDIVTNQDNFAPTGQDTASVLRITANTTEIDISGMANGTAGRYMIVSNAGSETIYLEHDDGDSDAENRFFFPELVDQGVLAYALAPTDSVELLYDGPTQKWVHINSGATAGYNLSFANNASGHKLNALSKTVTPPTITADENDYAPDVGNASVLNLQTDASREITGIAVNKFGGYIFVLYNVGAENIVLKNQDAGSLAANQFLMAGDVTLTPNACAVIQYSSGFCWRLMSTTV
jgi:hypothetical protein